jgi:hypothetical protein
MLSVRAGWQCQSVHALEKEQAVPAGSPGGQGVTLIIIPKLTVWESVGLPFVGYARYALAGGGNG